MKTIYKTIGAAKEYCEYAVDIYENCPHRCSYCYAKKKIEDRNGNFKFEGARKNIIEETENYLKANNDKVGEIVFLGFSSDAFPADDDCDKTLEMTKLLKKYGHKVMLCTKGSLRNENIKETIKLADSIGITITCGDDMAKIYEEFASSVTKRLELLKFAHECGKETWISFEPVLDANFVINLISSGEIDFIDVAKLGKLNHMELSDLTGNEKDVIDWADYAKKVIEACNERKINYKVKYALSKFL